MSESRKATGLGPASARGLAIMTSTNHRRCGLSIGCSLLALSLCCDSRGLIAQQVITVTTPDGQAVQVSPEQMKAMNPGQPGLPPGAQPAGPPGAPPPQGGKPGEGDQKKEGEGGDKKRKSRPRPSNVRRNRPAFRTRANSM